MEHKYTEYNCDQCKYRTLSLSNYQTHLKSIKHQNGGKRPRKEYVCQFCEYRTWQCGCFHKHMFYNHSPPKTITQALSKMRTYMKTISELQDVIKENPNDLLQKMALQQLINQLKKLIEIYNKLEKDNKAPENK